MFFLFKEADKQRNKTTLIAIDSVLNYTFEDSDLGFYMSDLIKKYNVPGPRYTSYPTVPYWDEERFSIDKWVSSLQKSFVESNEEEGISLYIHLPFCESLCTFCACNKRITKQHNVERPYIERVLKEWKMYLAILPNKPLIKEIHLGGGTPSFFSPDNLVYLIENILSLAYVAEDREFSFEGHPNNTTQQHLQALYALGFRRVSFGVQDFDPQVQKAIHRIQPVENVRKVTQWARDIGYVSVSHDLVFGLPFQRKENVDFSIRELEKMKPDRIAFYSYAHVPWIKGVGQRGYDEKDLPTSDEKRQIYETGKSMLEQLGYHEIGMDHFALPQDLLYKAQLNKRLHRNFMGYSASKTQLMIGLGMSAISDSWYSFSQNVKEVESYYERIDNNQWPLYRGHLLNEEDLIIRKHILNLMCVFETSWDDPKMQFVALDEVIARLLELEADGLVTIKPKGLEVTTKGRSFIRNIGMAFDLRMIRKMPNTALFSMTI